MSAGDSSEGKAFLPKDSPLRIRPATLADAHALTSLTLQSFKQAPFWDWVSKQDWSGWSALSVLIEVLCLSDARRSSSRQSSKARKNGG